MEGLAACSVGGRFGLRIPSARSRTHCRHVGPRSRSFRVLASRDGPELDKWDQMELKFGRLLGEDPKLTLAKIMARKSNPDVSYLDVEKEFENKKGKLDDSFVNLPSDIGLQGQAKDKNLNLSRPAMKPKKGVTAATPSLDAKLISSATQLEQSPQGSETKSEVPNVVALRKPTVFQGDGIESDKDSKVKVKPNLFLKMRKSSSASLSDVTLLRKPEVTKISVRPDQEHALSDDPGSSESNEEARSSLGGVKPSRADEEHILHGFPTNITEEDQDNTSGRISTLPELRDGLDRGLQLSKQVSVETLAEPSSALLGQNPDIYDPDVSSQAALLEKPQKLDSPVKEVPCPTKAEGVSLNNEDPCHDAEINNFVSADQEEREDNDWKRVEHLLQTGEKFDVELVGCSSRGFVVSFGSLIGFIPYRNLGAKWKFLAFESWLRKKGLDPSEYMKNLSILGSYDAQAKNLSQDLNENQNTNQKKNRTLSPKMRFEDLMEAYEQEKTNFLSSFVGQRIRVCVILADRKSRKLIFSGRPKEKEELIEKKRNLMAKLSVGDVVKCCIKKVTYFGIFVEVEGVPALIHQSEVSWDATIDPSSYYKIGQIVEAKVHQLDYALERITLSLKEITPDPLMEALESVVGEHTSLGGSLEAAQPDVEWADVESLIKELQQIDGINDVSKGRFFLSPGLAPTFQVYMASMFDNQYKLLARYGNKVQEVIVQASLDKERMKAAILTCTNKVV